MCESQKVCIKCKRSLPANTDHFFKNSGRKDGMLETCKECQGKSFTKHLQIKDGEMCCKKCKRILPYNDEYFPKDKNTKTGLRNVCYECKGSKFGKRKEKSLEWSKEEDELLLKVYADNLNEEIIHLFPNRTSKALQDHAMKLGLSKSETAKEKKYKKQSEYMKENSCLIGRVVSEEEKQRLSKQMKEKWKSDYENMLNAVRYERTQELKDSIANLRKEEGRWKGKNNPRAINPLKGELNGNWKGGITPLLFWFRNQLDDWKQKSMRHHNYTCVITGKNFDEIHHLYSFKYIVEETLKELHFDYIKDISSFTEEELEILRNSIIKNNNKYGLGVCLTKEIHKLYHDNYGYGSNTPEQFEEFKTRYHNNEFNHLLEGIV